MEESPSGRLLQEESKKEGAVAFHVYRAYWRAVGWGLGLAILFSLILMQGRREAWRPLSHPQPRLLGPHHIHHLLLTLTKPRDSAGKGDSWDKRPAPNSERVPEMHSIYRCAL